MLLLRLPERRDPLLESSECEFELEFDELLFPECRSFPEEASDAFSDVSLFEDDRSVPVSVSAPVFEGVEAFAFLFFGADSLPCGPSASLSVD